MKRHYYGIEYSYGEGWTDEDGYLLGAIHQFDTLESYLAWVRGGPAHAHERGYREGIYASDRTCRQAIRRGWLYTESDRQEERKRIAEQAIN